MSETEAERVEFQDVAVRSAGSCIPHGTFLGPTCTLKFTTSQMKERADSAETQTGGLPL
jgi:hypothetical protein